MWNSDRKVQQNIGKTSALKTVKHYLEQLLI